MSYWVQGCEANKLSQTVNWSASPMLLARSQSFCNRRRLCLVCLSQIMCLVWLLVIFYTVLSNMLWAGTAAEKKTFVSSLNFRLCCLSLANWAPYSLVGSSRILPWSNHVESCSHVGRRQSSGKS